MEIFLLSFLMYSVLIRGGDGVSIISSLEQLTPSEIIFLRKYNYIESEDNKDEKIHDAICKFQKFMDIEVTCIMDEETRALMKQPRCGIPDILINNNTLKNNQFSNYVLQGYKWTSKHLTWRITQYSNQFSKADLDNAANYSFRIWSSVSGLSFEHKLSGRVDIELGFYKYGHLSESSDQAFDGNGGVLAHAFFPNYGGDVHLDESEHWGIRRSDYDPGLSTKNIKVVIVHELGHALGLRHEPQVQDSVMRPVYSGWADEVILSDDDIAAIRRLYGNEQGIEPDIPDTNKNLFCNSQGIDTMFEYERNSYYAFKDDMVRRIPIQGRAENLAINNTFRGSLRPRRKVDASLYIGDQYRWNYYGGRWRFEIVTPATVYLFQGSRVYSFREVQGIFRQIDVSLIGSRFRGAPDHLDAAFVWSGNHKIYLVKGDKYYKMASYGDFFSVYYGYPRSFSIWRGLGGSTQAAVHMARYDVTVFFKRNRYFLFNDAIFQVAKNYPRDLANDWFGCHRNEDLVTDVNRINSPLKRDASFSLITDNATRQPELINLPTIPNTGRVDPLSSDTTDLTEPPPLDEKVTSAKTSDAVSIIDISFTHIYITLTLSIVILFITN